MLRKNKNTKHLLTSPYHGRLGQTFTLQTAEITLGCSLFRLYFFLMETDCSLCSYFQPRKAFHYAAVGIFPEIVED